MIADRFSKRKQELQKKITTLQWDLKMVDNEEIVNNKKEILNGLMDELEDINKKISASPLEEDEENGI